MPSSPPAVYFVTPWFGLFAGGAERAFRSVAKELQRRGVEVEVLTTCSGELYGDWTRDGLPAGPSECDSVRVRRFPVNKADIDRYHRAVRHSLEHESVPQDLQYDFFRYGISSDALIEHVGRLPEDAAIVAGPYFQSLTFATLSAHPDRIHVLGAFHDEPQFRWKPISDLFAAARGFLFLSVEEKDLAIRTYGLQEGRGLLEAPVVGLGVELDLASEGPGLAHESDSAGHLDQEPLPDEFFLALGRKDRGKGMVELIQWFSEFDRRRVRAGLPSVPLLIAGSGEGDLVPASPIFRELGFVEEDQKTRLLRRASAVINLSRNESFSYVLMESWLCGTPVVVSADCAVTAGHCRRCGGGYTVDGAAEFNAALDVFLREPMLGRSAGEAGQAYVTSVYGWDDVVDRFLRALG